MKRVIDSLLKIVENILFVVIYCMLFLRIGHLLGYMLQHGHLPF